MVGCVSRRYAVVGSALLASCVCCDVRCCHRAPPPAVRCFRSPHASTVVPSRACPASPLALARTKQTVATSPVAARPLTPWARDNLRIPCVCALVLFCLLCCHSVADLRPVVFAVCTVNSLVDDAWCCLASALARDCFTDEETPSTASWFRTKEVRTENPQRNQSSNRLKQATKQSTLYPVAVTLRRGALQVIVHRKHVCLGCSRLGCWCRAGRCCIGGEKHSKEVHHSHTSSPYHADNPTSSEVHTHTTTTHRHSSNTQRSNSKRTCQRVRVAERCTRREFHRCVVPAPAQRVISRGHHAAQVKRGHRRRHGHACMRAVPRVVSLATIGHLHEGRRQGFGVPGQGKGSVQVLAHDTEATISAEELQIDREAPNQCWTGR